MYSLRNVLICNLIKASNLESQSLAEEVSHALSRSAGLFVTVTALWVIFQSVSIYTFEKRDWRLALESKLTMKTCTRRVMMMNIIAILLIMWTYTVEETFSVPCKDECPVGPENLIP